MQTELIKQISATIGKTKVESLSQILASKNTDLNELIDLTFYPDKGIAFRAAWLLENIFLDNPDSFIPYLTNFIGRIKAVTNPSCKRHYAKILMHITSPSAPITLREKVKEINLEPAIEQCFDWIIDPNVLVAVKSFASEALFNMRHRYPWIAEELPNQLEYLMRDGTAAIQSKGRRLLSYLNPENRPGY
jgi:hypothetical protein